MTNPPRAARPDEEWTRDDRNFERSANVCISAHLLSAVSAVAGGPKVLTVALAVAGAAGLLAQVVYYTRLKQRRTRIPANPDGTHGHPALGRYDP